MMVYHYKRSRSFLQKRSQRLCPKQIIEIQSKNKSRALYSFLSFFFVIRINKDIICCRHPFKEIRKISRGYYLNIMVLSLQKKIKPQQTTYSISIWVGMRNDSNNRVLIQEFLEPLCILCIHSAKIQFLFQLPIVIFPFSSFRKKGNPMMPK